MPRENRIVSIHHPYAEYDTISRCLFHWSDNLDTLAFHFNVWSVLFDQILFERLKEY